MNDPRWKDVRELFAAVVKSGPEERRRILDGLRTRDPVLAREVESLIEADQAADDFLERPPPLSAELLTRNPAGFAPGDRLGPYRIVREVARGGMGDVYLADRADGEYRQRVAIKVLHPELRAADSAARFVAERQILAALDHPNIARLLDGGTTPDGRPYLVMEHIDGVPITEYCSSRDLQVEDRLRLFVRVCRAVGYAHRNLVVHRDLKPSNLLVADGGEPKLLDFGIAKMLAESELAKEAPRTRTGLHLMTPSYASPEQVRGDPITTASDVYQLGLLLHEVLSGERPFELDARSPLELQRAVCEADPPPLPDTLPADLDTIVAMALRKEPERRYASADQLADDLERLLAHRPVAARPDTWRYRAGRFVQRNRLPVAAAATVCVLLVSLAAVSLRFAATTAEQSRAIAGERDRARAGEARAEHVTEFMVDLFESALPAAERRDTLTVRSVLAQAGERIEEELQGEPKVHATLLNAVGRIQYSLGATDEGVAQVERALALRRDLYDEPHPDLVESLYHRATQARLGYQLAMADSLYREALAVHRALPRRDPLRTAELLEGRASTLRNLGRTDTALVLIREAVALREALQDGHDPSYLESLGILAYVLRAAGELDEAERLYRQVLAGQRSLGASARHRLPWTLNALGYVLVETGRPEDAEPLYREAVAVHGELYGEGHLTTLQLMGELTNALEGGGKLAEAEAVAREALRRARITHPDTSWQVGRQHVVLGSTLAHSGRYEEATTAFRTGLDLFSTVLGANHLWTAAAEHELGSALLLGGRVRGAQVHLDRSYARLREDPQRASTLLNPTNLETVVERLRTSDDSVRAARYEAILERIV